MRPILSITAAVPALIYINGGFLGETGPDAPVISPLRESGTIYIEVKPLSSDFAFMARRVSVKGGALIRSSCEGQTGMRAVVWPGGVTDLEFDPECAPVSRRICSGVTYTGGISPRVISESGLEFDLPEGARPPKKCEREGLLSGACADGSEYIMLISDDMLKIRGFVRADSIRLYADGFTSINRGRDNREITENWKIQNGMFILESSSERAPETQIDIAIAALNALMSGQSTNCADASAINEIKMATDNNTAATKMKYPPMDAVGLITFTGENTASVTPYRYACSSSESGWKLSHIEPY